MKRFAYIAAALLCLALPAAKAQDTAATARYDSLLLKPGEAAPDFAFANAGPADGKTLGSLRGSYVVLEFWASWCPDCRRQTKGMARLHKEYAPRGVEFVGVSFDTDSAAWQRYVKANAMEWTQSCELKKWKRGTTTDRPYRVDWIPAFYLIDPQGKVATASVDLAKVEAALKALPLPAAAKPAAAKAETGSGAAL